MKTLRTPLEEIGFVDREKRNGKTVVNKCGRDFLYYALNFYHPNTFNSRELNPVEIDRQKLFGTPTASWLAWTQVQFKNVGRYLKQQDLSLSINERPITSYGSFVRAIIFSRYSCDSALTRVQAAVDENSAAGIDVSLGIGGLFDHILFVYGYDEKNLYVCDTHQVPRLEYRSTDQHPLLFKLPKDIIRARWTRFGRVWEVKMLK